MFQESFGVMKVSMYKNCGVEFYNIYLLFKYCIHLICFADLK